MAMEQELFSLRSKQSELIKKLKDNEYRVHELYVQKAPLMEKLNIMNTKTSELSKALAEKIRMEIDEINHKIDIAYEEQTKIEESLRENERDIFEKENELGLYIQRQVASMIPAFLRYIKDHMEEIGLKMKKTYEIKEVTKFDNHKYFGCYIPTGNVGIYDVEEKVFIVTSVNPVFRGTQYNISREEDGELCCEYTDEFNLYLNDFISQIIKSLKEKYDFADTFKLSVDGTNTFVLELI